MAALKPLLPFGTEWQLAGNPSLPLLHTVLVKIPPTVFCLFSLGPSRNLDRQLDCLRAKSHICWLLKYKMEESMSQLDDLDYWCLGSQNKVLTLVAVISFGH